MSKSRTIYWNDAELPFGDPPSKLVPDAATLETDIELGWVWKWDYHGLVGVLPLAVMRNALETYLAYKQHRHQREPVPKSVGVFTWGQTVSVEETQKPLNTDSPAEPAGGGEAKK